MIAGPPGYPRAHRGDTVSDKTKTDVRLYEVRGSEPPTEDRHWRHNFAAMVLARSLAAAVAHVEQTRPEGTDIHDVISRSAGRNVEWAVDRPAGPGGATREPTEETPRCQEPTCPDFGDPDFGEATCPSDHAEENR